MNLIFPNNLILDWILCSCCQPFCLYLNLLPFMKYLNLQSDQYLLIKNQTAPNEAEYIQWIWIVTLYFEDKQ